MLPMYIIEELEKDRMSEAEERVYIERPELDDSINRRQKRPVDDESDEQKRGVIIVDYTI